MYRAHKALRYVHGTTSKPTVGMQEYALGTRNQTKDMYIDLSGASITFAGQVR